MSRARTLWKWTALTLAGVGLLLALMVVGLHFWLTRSPELGPGIVARVEQLTGLRISYAQLDARLGLYGPELVFREAAVAMPGQRDPVVSARAGRVGFDLWRALRTGRLASGRVVLEGARLYVFVTEEGVELRGQGVMPGAGGTRLALGQLPVGHLRIEDASVTVNDLRNTNPPWRVERVSLDLERDLHALAVRGGVKLPDALGARLDVDVRLKGDLATPATLDWDSEVVLNHASLAGWTALVPRWHWLPSAGQGDLSVTARGHGAVLERAETHLDLKDVRTPAPVGGAAGELRALAGTLSVVQRGPGWIASGHDLTIDTGHVAWRHGEFELGYEPQSRTGGSFSLRSAAIQLDALSALAPLVPEGVVHEAVSALAPRGLLTGVDVRAIRGNQAGEWRIDGGVHYAGLGIGAWRGVPGLTGLDGDWQADGHRGRVHLRSSGLSLDLARALREPVRADSAALTLDYWWQPDGWRFATDDVQVKSPDATLHGMARLLLPVNPEESPRLVLDFKANGVDARHASRYLPGRILPASTMHWLDNAFLAGRVPEAHIEFAGELRRFPFRDGGGLFRVRFAYEGLRIHYHDEFGDIEDAWGDAEFKNEGFSARATRALVHGMHITGANAGMLDFKDAELYAHATAQSDVRDALLFLQQSLVGPKLGEYFMKVAGQGPLTARVDLKFPFRRFAEREIVVEGQLSHAVARLPGLDDPVRDISGPFTLHDKELTVPGLTATVLGGPARLRARTVAGVSGRGGERLLIVEGQGRALAERLQSAIGITQGSWLGGGADWKLLARLPRLEWRPPPDPVPQDAPLDAVPTVHEVETRYLPTTIHLESSLTGLALAFPAPLAKPADESRPLRLDITIDPGLEENAPHPPGVSKRRDVPRPPSLIAQVQLGHDAGQVEWRHDDAWHLARGTLRFGGGAPQLRSASGLWLEGRIPDYDLSAWLRVHMTAGPSHGLGEYLRGGSLVVGRFGIFGFHFADVTLGLEGRDEAWNVQVDGAAARGRLVVPWNLPGERPLTLDMERLVIGEHLDVVGPAEEATDPTQLPALAIRVRSLEIQKRRFGSLEADLSRTVDGLKLDRAQVKGASFQASAHGSWVIANGAQQSVVSVALESTDVLDTLTAWGFEPVLAAKSGRASGELRWPGSIDIDMFGRMTGSVKIAVDQGQVMSVDPGAGRVLGLLSLTALPRRLMLDFSDLTEKGFAFDRIKGDFELKDGNAFTNDLVLKGPAAEIGIVGRTGIKTRDYDQTAKVTGHLSGPLAAAGVLAAGPAVGAALLLFSTVFKEPLGGVARGYYRITGSWEKPTVERIGAGQAREAEKVIGGEAPR
ncbi:MAG: AsmA-like C-terminal region-containing protein [Pseudomonadota bacterium]